MVLQDFVPVGENETPPAGGPPLDYAEARRVALSAFERDHVAALLAAHGGKVPAAARAAGMARVYLYRLIRRHGLKP